MQTALDANGKLGRPIVRSKGGIPGKVKLKKWATPTQIQQTKTRLALALAWEKKDPLGTSRHLA